MIDVRLACPACGTNLDGQVESGGIECACGQRIPLDVSSIEASSLTHCPNCGTADLYLQKDFPHQIGVAIVVIGAIVATIFWARYSWVGTFATLFLCGAVDAVLYYTRKNVLVCYRCLAQYRGTVEREGHRPFDLGIGERYRQERIRIDQHRRAQAP